MTAAPKLRVLGPDQEPADEYSTRRAAFVEPRRVGYVEAAAFLGVKAGTLRALVSRGQVPHVRISARLVVFEIGGDGEHSLDRWLEKRRVEVGGR
jgi:hypothetical protein